MPRTLRQIKNLYAQEFGAIGRKCPADKKAYNQARYQLNASTFFHAYQDFLQTTFPEAKKEREMEEENWFVLFRQLTSGGAPEFIPSLEPFAGTPAEAAICAAIDLELKQEQKRSISESKLVDKICSDWPGINIDVALQLAVIEWLTNAHNFAQKTTHEKIDIPWYTIIKTLLSLGADPNYPCDTFRHQLPPSHFSVTTDHLSSAFQLLIFAVNRTVALLNLAEDFLAQQKQKDRKLTIHLDRMRNALPFPTSKPFIDLGFKFIEKTCRDDLAIYLSTSLENIVTNLESVENYEAIEYLRNEYKLDTFVSLVEKLKNISTLRHLYKNYYNQFEKHLKESPDKYAQLFNVCIQADKAKFDDLDTELKKLLIKAFMESLLKSTEKPLVETPLFKYLEKNFPEELNSFLEKNLALLLNKFLDFKVQDEKSVVRLAKLPGIVPVYFQTIETRYAKYGLTENESFGEIAKYHDEELLRFFRKDITKPLAKKLDGQNSKNVKLLAYVYNFDWYRAWNGFSRSDHAILGDYYQRRANAILDFIFNQKYRLAAAVSNTFIRTFAKEMSHNGKTVRLSIAMVAIVESLNTVLKAPELEKSELFKNVYGAVKHDNSATIDQSERDITKALVSHLTDDSELSDYVEQQFLLHRTNPYLQKAPDAKMERKGP